VSDVGAQSFIGLAEQPDESLKLNIQYYSDDNTHPLAF
jgi:hypothetical protein